MERYKEGPYFQGKGMERYKEGPYFLNFLEIWPFLIPFHTFPIRSIVMEIQTFFPVCVSELRNTELNNTGACCHEGE